MTEHIITISRDNAFIERLSALRAPDEQDRKDAYVATIQCTISGGCGGWQECREVHEPGGDHGPYDCEADAPWEGADEYEFHGIVHEWKWGYGWTVPFVGCIAATYGWDSDLPDGIDTSRDGRWLVDDEWEDDECYLSLVRELTGETDE